MVTASGSVPAAAGQGAPARPARRLRGDPRRPRRLERAVPAPLRGRRGDQCVRRRDPRRGPRLVELPAALLAAPRARGRPRACSSRSRPRATGRGGCCCARRPWWRRCWGRSSCSTCSTRPRVRLHAPSGATPLVIEYPLVERYEGTIQISGVPRGAEERVELPVRNNLLAVELERKVLVRTPPRVRVVALVPPGSGALPGRRPRLAGGRAAGVGILAEGPRAPVPARPRAARDHGDAVARPASQPDPGHLRRLSAAAAQKFPPPPSWQFLHSGRFMFIGSLHLSGQYCTRLKTLGPTLSQVTLVPLTLISP